MPMAGRCTDLEPDDEHAVHLRVRRPGRIQPPLHPDRRALRQVGHRIADGKGEFIGNVSAGHDDHDIGLVPTDSENRMYIGGGDSNTGVDVVGWRHVFVGQYLCQSGVTSAEATGAPVCNLTVIFFWQDSEDLVEAEQVQGQTAARGGDSDVSVYSSNGSGGVVANGTVTRAGGNRLGFQDFATANRDFGVTIP